MEKNALIFYINGYSSLAYNVGNGGYVGRVDFPNRISSNDNFISVYSCEGESCSFYYIDKVNDHKYADHDEFVFDPFYADDVLVLKNSLGLPYFEAQ